MDNAALHLARDALLQKVSRLAENSPAVQGIFLGGSLAAGNPDAYSDIDFRVVIDPAMDKELLLGDLLRQLEPILFIETKTNFYAVIHFDTFIKLDLFLYYPAELLPSPWLANIAIQSDHTQHLHEVKAQSAALRHQVTQAEFDFFLTKYYANLHEYYRRWKRDERNYTATCQLMILHCLVSFWYLEKGLVPNSLGDWSKYEGARTQLTADQLTQLSSLAQLHGQAFLTAVTTSVQEVTQAIVLNYPLIFDSKQYARVTALVHR